MNSATMRYKIYLAAYFVSLYFCFMWREEREGKRHLTTGVLFCVLVVARLF